jgi:hypothetical protein
MKLILGLTLVIALVAGGLAAAKADFSGTWVFNPAKSKNVGPMSSMQLTSTIQQNGSTLSIKDDSKFMGQESERDTHYDLSGKPVPNQNFMGENAETVTRWVGDKLVTTWKTEGAIAGTTVIRTETRSLSGGGKTMTLESVRGANPPVVMVFDRK